METARLVLCRQSKDDAAFMLQLMNSPGWLKYIGDRGVNTIADARAYITNGAMKSYELNGFGLYLTKLKEGNVPIGVCGLIKRPGLDQVDIGFAFLEEHAGKGYGFEAASAIIKHARESLDIDIIIAITTKDNEPSIKLLNKLGFYFKEPVLLPGNKEQLMLFEHKKLPDVNV